MSWFRCLLLCVLCGIIAAVPVQAQEARPRSERAPVQALDAVATHALSALNNTALQARYPQHGPGPLRFAEPRATSLQPHADGTWERLDDGTMLWRLRVRSEGARSLNLGFTDYHMPPGGQLFLYTPDYASVIGPFTEGDNESHPELWTPIIPGEEVIVEVTVPASQTSALELTLGQVNHGFQSLRPAGQSSTAKASGACNVDVACEVADAWRAEARAVGRYTTEDGVLCTGVLVNNTANDGTPYFLTANHCGVTPDKAASVVVYWNFEHPTCRSSGDAGGSGDGSLDHFTTGADYRAGYGFGLSRIAGRPDFTLVELDEPIDPAYDVYFAGWNREDGPTNRSVGIHHPQGEEKRISLDEDPSTVTSYLSSSIGESGATHLRVGDWERGTTEAGSSGSPLFNADHHLVGTLSGGFAGCSTDNPAVDNDKADWYGRFAGAWEGGGTPETSLAPWLDPDGVSPLSLHGRNQNADVGPPAPITDLRVISVRRDEVTLQWTATGGDGTSGRALFYALRYDTSPIRTHSDFRSASPVPSVPAPRPAGTTETFTVDGLDRNVPYYFALIAFNARHDSSPLAATTENAIALQEDFTLKPVFPNPTPAQATVQFAVENEQHVELHLYDARGRRVRTLYRDTPVPNRQKELTFDGSHLASGRYFVRIVGETFTDAVPFTLVR